MCEIDSAEPSLRVLQCVDPSAGLRFTVQSRIRASNRGVSLRAPCPAWRLNSPASRSRPNRLLQRAINASLQLSLSRICAQLSPAANRQITPVPPPQQPDTPPPPPIPRPTAPPRRPLPQFPTLPFGQSRSCFS